MLQNLLKQQKELLNLCSAHTRTHEDLKAAFKLLNVYLEVEMDDYSVIGHILGL